MKLHSKETKIKYRILESIYNFCYSIFTKHNKDNTLERLFKLIVFLLIVGFGLYFTFPYNLSRADLNATYFSILTTLMLTAGGVAIGVVFGLIISFLRFLENRIINFIIDEYIDIMRGTPIVIQLLIFAYVIFAAMNNNFLAALVALGLNSSAYIAEIIRAGINSVDKGQMDASKAMGLSRFTTMKEIIMPQAIKNILPGLANEFIVVFKDTSVVGFVSVNDITFQSKTLQALLYNPMPMIFAAVVYYAFVKIFSFLVEILEKQLKKHD